jgi:hypothetical protein
MNGHYTMDNKDFVKNRNVKVRIQILERAQVSGPMLEKKSRVIMITEEQVVGFLDGNAGFV